MAGVLEISAGEDVGGWRWPEGCAGCGAVEEFLGVGSEAVSILPRSLVGNVDCNILCH